ncbi:hypothetical protein GN244_ATG20550 [Phytophthora infestans]|uniref:Uncharacterized protein n=1 Tax=Phytophthora infestans TaxID=4787 RepID=A0A833W420_PHYIN|nr:hypothetical protein GN244_ATG20550 [Phytophthora infestans]
MYRASLIPLQKLPHECASAAPLLVNSTAGVNAAICGSALVMSDAVLQPLARRELHSVRRPIARSSSSLLPELQLYSMTQRWHGHGHSHGVFEEEEETEEERALKLKLSAEDVKAADRTWVGVWLNVVLSGLKGVAGVAFHSSGLTLDK